MLSYLNVTSIVHILKINLFTLSVSSTILFLPNSISMARRLMFVSLMLPSICICKMHVCLVFLQQLLLDRENISNNTQNRDLLYFKNFWCQGIVMGWIWNALTDSCIWILGPQSVALFEEFLQLFVGTQPMMWINKGGFWRLYLSCLSAWLFSVSAYCKMNNQNTWALTTMDRASLLARPSKA